MPASVCGLLLTGALALSAVAGAQTTIAIEGASVISMDRDTVLADHTVVTAGRRIVWVGPSRLARIPPGAVRVNGRGKYLMPGLADMHVHLDARRDLETLVFSGITTVRNMRGAPIHLAWRDSIGAGQLRGPQIFTTGPSLRGGGGKGFASASDPTEAARAVEAQAAAGYDLIKVLYGIDAATFDAITTTAAKHRIAVVGHLLEDVGLETTMAKGQRSLEHLVGLLSLTPPLRERALSLLGRRRPLDAAMLDSGARAIASAGAFVGTIVTGGGACGSPNPVAGPTVAALRRAGVRLLAGSDMGLSPVTGTADLHCELRTLFDLGLSTREVLASATSVPGMFAAAHIKGSEKFGVVAVGFRSDLILLAGNPLSDLSTLERPTAVILGGVLLPMATRRP